MKFNERLQEILKAKDITQRELAEKISINETAMSRYVNGTRKPRMDILVNIANALNVSVPYLSGESEEEAEYIEIKNLVARNLGKLNDEQRLELMEILARRK